LALKGLCLPLVSVDINQINIMAETATVSQDTSSILLSNDPTTTVSSDKSSTKIDIGGLTLDQAGAALASAKPSMKDYVESKVLLLSELCINCIVANFESKSTD
jgi:hypothetical protein